MKLATTALMHMLSDSVRVRTMTGMNVGEKIFQLPEVSNCR